MNETEMTAALLTKAEKMYGVKTRCQHLRTTLVQHVSKTFGWYACYQCDKCGQVTRQPVSAEDLDGANNAPWLDIAMYEQVTTERFAGDTANKTLAFFGKATR